LKSIVQFQWFLGSGFLVSFHCCSLLSIRKERCCCDATGSMQRNNARAAREIDCAKQSAENGLASAAATLMRVVAGGDPTATT
jgi:hypothetical protein